MDIIRLRLLHRSFHSLLLDYNQDHLRVSPLAAHYPPGDSAPLLSSGPERQNDRDERQEAAVSRDVRSIIILSVLIENQWFGKKTHQKNYDDNH